MKKIHISNCMHGFWKFNIMYPWCLVAIYVYITIYIIYLCERFLDYLYDVEELKKNDALLLIRLTITIYSQKQSIFRNVVYTLYWSYCQQDSILWSEMLSRKSSVATTGNQAVTRQSVKCRLLSSPFDGWTNPFNNDIIVIAGTFPSDTRDEAQRMEFTKNPVL